MKNQHGQLAYQKMLQNKKKNETRIYNEESLRKVLNEDIILNIRLNFSRDFIEDISLHSNEQHEKQLSDYTYDDIYNIITDYYNEDDQKKFEKKYSKIKLMTISVLLPIFQLLNLGRNI